MLQNFKLDEDIYNSIRIGKKTTLKINIKINKHRQTINKHNPIVKNRDDVLYLREIAYVAHIVSLK